MRKFEEERKRHQREERKRTKKFKDAEEARRDQILRRQRIPDADYFHLHSRCEDENGVFRRDAPIDEYLWHKAKGVYWWQFNTQNWRKKVTAKQAKLWCDIYFDHFQQASPSKSRSATDSRFEEGNEPNLKAESWNDLGSIW
mgnify:FL=1